MARLQRLRQWRGFKLIRREVTQAAISNTTIAPSPLTGAIATSVARSGAQTTNSTWASANLALWRCCELPCGRQHLGLGAVQRPRLLPATPRHFSINCSIDACSLGAPSTSRTNPSPHRPLPVTKSYSVVTSLHAYYPSPSTPCPTIAAHASTTLEQYLTMLVPHLELVGP